ncbi:MAG: 4-(cytidine 5'-diphospho)-2-C-methyl-D-erythritol kinase [Pseudomonadota bacterium]
MPKQTDEKIVRETAPAKVNLFLHVVGKRPDGYHLLESLIAFATDGDVITVEPARKLSLKIDGDYAAPLNAEEDNLVLSAAKSLAEAVGREPKVKLRLTKSLPVAAGVGGGSADAAATLRALCRLWEVTPEPELLHGLATRLGADVPVCLESQTAYVAGIGEEITPLPSLPSAPALLINPNLPVSTAAVFRARTGPFSAPGACDLRRLQQISSGSDLARVVGTLRNDLDPPARKTEPAIGDVLGAVRACAGVTLARMSGSGATCFGLFDSIESRDAAAETLKSNRPDWWVMATHLGGAALTTRTSVASPRANG